ncbi:C40 family peptidase [Nocardia sp. NPDC059764]|uniref:C40 family peptidase n=1 Tax=Nocardia sp. NPDC059764 TaxID=3346939 RepID=UPI003649DE81
MSDDLTAAELEKPIVELLRSLGSGRSTAADVLRETARIVDAAHAESRGSVDRMYDEWRGRAGDAALDKALRTQTTAATAAERGRAMAEILDRTDAEVATGRRELAEILRAFRAELASLSSEGNSPGGATAVVASAIDHIGRAMRVVERVRAELATEAAAMEELSGPIPAPTVVAPGALGDGDAKDAPPAAVTGPGAAGPLPDSAGGLPDGAGTVPAGMIHASGDPRPHAATVPAGHDTSTGGGAIRTIGGGLLGAGRSAGGDGRLGAGRSRGDRVRTTTASVFTAKGPGHDSPVGSPNKGGVWVTLPDGSRVEAPNERAAEAVRKALSAVGTPYEWGGVTPGVGVDCSGLTQWAYGQAGVSLPRLAQEQGLGHPSIGPGGLMPGDLAVWDGHVAMVIGNGQLVEAGDPVRIGPIRTENSGMRFLGFYRPTA